MIAALFVDPDGPYKEYQEVDMWDVNRDARLYKGPYRVVAHPPCNRWGKMAPVNLARWGTPIGEDGGCFKSALESVLEWGGVLEHPAQTLAWTHFGLEKPSGKGWKVIGKDLWVGEVWQSDYGHLATKKTWLLYKGANPKPFITNRVKGSHQVGGGIHTGNNKKPRLAQKITHITPPLFAEYLLELVSG